VGTVRNAMINIILSIVCSTVYSRLSVRTGGVGGNWHKSQVGWVGTVLSRLYVQCKAGWGGWEPPQVRVGVGWVETVAISIYS
jgi:hypothetical protein